MLGYFETEWSNVSTCVCSQANGAGDFFPIWGTCMGMQLLTVLVAGRNLLSNTTAENLALPLQLTDGSIDAGFRDTVSACTSHDHTVAAEINYKSWRVCACVCVFHCRGRVQQDV